MDAIKKHYQKIGKLGGIARAKKLSKKRRLEISKLANLSKKKKARLRVIDWVETHVEK